MEGKNPRLDLLFLIFPPFLTLVFVLLFGEFLFLLVPSVALTWLMPMYVGYWRGAIKRESRMERIRALVYLLLGLLSFSFFVVFISF